MSIVWDVRSQRCWARGEHDDFADETQAWRNIRSAGHVDLLVPLTGIRFDIHTIRHVLSLWNGHCVTDATRFSAILDKYANTRIDTDRFGSWLLGCQLIDSHARLLWQRRGALPLQRKGRHLNLFLATVHGVLDPETREITQLLTAHRIPVTLHWDSWIAGLDPDEPEAPREVVVIWRDGDFTCSLLLARGLPLAFRKYPVTADTLTVDLCRGLGLTPSQAHNLLTGYARGTLMTGTTVQLGTTNVIEASIPRRIIEGACHALFSDLERMLAAFRRQAGDVAVNSYYPGGVIAYDRLGKGAVVQIIMDLADPPEAGHAAVFRSRTDKCLTLARIYKKKILYKPVILSPEGKRRRGKTLPDTAQS